MARTTWRKLLTEAFDEVGDSWSEVEFITLTAAELDTEFDCGYGNTEVEPFAVWTAKTVYFPACYDGSEWVAWVPRHP